MENIENKFSMLQRCCLEIPEEEQECEIEIALHQLLNQSDTAELSPKSNERFTMEEVEQLCDYIADYLWERTQTTILSE